MRRIPETIAQQWVEALDRAHGAPIPARGAVIGGLEQAAQRWASFSSSVNPDSLAGYLLERVRNGLDNSAALAGVHWADLVLAAACLQRVDSALRALDDLIRAPLSATLRNRGASGAEIEEFSQLTRVRILVGTDGRPKLVEYSGRGALVAWVKVVALRTYLNARGTAPALAEEEAETLVRQLICVEQPEVDAIRRQAHRHFDRALQEAVRTLPSDDRRLLRARFVEGIDLNELARRHAVDRATIVRWLAKARAEFRERLSGFFADRLGVTPRELSSLLQLIQSQPAFNLAEVLASVRKQHGNNEGT